MMQQKWLSAPKPASTVVNPPAHAKQLPASVPKKASTTSSFSARVTVQVEWMRRPPGAANAAASASSFC